MRRRIPKRCIKGVVNHWDQPQIWQGKIALDTEQGFRTTKWRTSKCSSGQRPCKRRVRRLRLVLLEAQHDQVRSVRLGAAGKYEKGAVSGAGVGSHSTVTCRTTDGTVRRGSNSGCTVFGTLSARQRRQAAAISVRRAQQDERYIRPKDNGFLALLPTGRSR